MLVLVAAAVVSSISRTSMTSWFSRAQRVLLLREIINPLRSSGWLRIATFGLLAACGQTKGTSGNASNSEAALMTPQDLQALPSQAADVRAAYGKYSSQYGELRVPAGPGPHPVVVLIHGGCFKAAYATLRDLAPMGEALKANGIATWNIEYRRLGEPGGGWSGTYLDV